jgi:hypothetical protein
MRLTRCIDALYRVFAEYPRFDGYLECTHCVPESSQDRLRSAPLRVLDASALQPVVYNAGVGTFGAVTDYKHFLPRMAELLASGAIAASEASWVFSGLSLYNAAEWPTVERAALRTYLEAYLADRSAAWTALPTAPTIDLLDALARCFPTDDVVSAIEALPTPSYAMVLGHLGWSLDGMGPELARVWQAVATADGARRVEPLFAELDERDDLHPILADLLAVLPSTRR